MAISYYQAKLRDKMFISVRNHQGISEFALLCAGDCWPAPSCASEGCCERAEESGTWAGRGKGHHDFDCGVFKDA